MVEVAGIEPPATSSQDSGYQLVSVSPVGVCTQIGTHLNIADVETLRKILEVWPKLPTSVKVSIQLLVEAQGGASSW